MKSLGKKWLLTAGILLCLAPTALLAKPQHDKCRPGRRCEQVPEGGSAIVYLLGAGMTCLGAMFVRSRAANAR